MNILVMVNGIMKRMNKYLQVSAYQQKMEPATIIVQLTGVGEMIWYVQEDWTMKAANFQIIVIMAVSTTTIAA